MHATKMKRSKSRLHRILRAGISLLLTLCMIVPMVIVGNVSVSANPIAGKAVDQLIEDGMRLCCMGLDWLGESTGNEDVEKAFSLIESWCFMSAEEVAIEELKELCEEILAELDEIEEEMTESFAVLGSVLAKDEIITARGRVDAKWTSSVDNVIKYYQATNALSKYKHYLSDAVGGADAQTLNQDMDSLIAAYSGMYPGEIPVESNNTEKLKEIMFEQGTVNTKFSNLISDLAAGLNYDPLVSDSLALLASQFAYKAYPFSHQQYKYLHAVMEKQIMYIMLVEMMYNEYLYQQGEYLKDKFGENSDQYQGYLGYQRSFYELMTSGDSCVNSLIGKMLDAKMPVDGLGKINLSLNDYMRPEDACKVALNVKDYVSELDFKQEVRDYGVLGYKIQDESNISKSKYCGSIMIFNRVMTHTQSGNKVYYILDPSQFKNPNEALAVQALDHKIDIRLDADVHTESCDYVNYMKEMSDGVNTYRVINDPELAEIAPLFDTNYFALSGSSVDGYLGGTGPYLPKMKSGTSQDGFTKLFYLTPTYKRTSWAPAITAYTEYKVLDGSKLFTGGKVTIKDGWKDDVLDTGSSDFKNNKTNYGFSIILSNKSSTFKQKVTATVFRNAVADIKITASDGKSVTAGNSMNTESGKILDIAINGRGSVPDELDLLSAGGQITIAGRSDFENMTPDSDGTYHVKYAMPYSESEFILYMPENVQSVSIGDIQNSVASLDKNKMVKTKNYRYGEMVYFYMKCPEGYIPSDLKIVDKNGKEMGYPFYVSEHKEGNETVYVFDFYMNYTRDVIVTGAAEPGITISMDTSKFIYDSNNALKAYIQLEDYNTKTFYDEPILVSSMYNTVYGRYIFDDDYYPSHMKVVGQSTGTVFYDKDVSNKSSGDTFMLINQLMTTEFMPFGEDVMVIPTFTPNDPKVTLDDFTNCSASFDISSAETKKRFKPGDEVTFYLTVPAECDKTDIIAVDNNGDQCDVTSAGNPVQDGTNMIYTYKFTMPSSNVIVCGEAYESATRHTASIGSFTGGTASFDMNSSITEAVFEENEKVNFYVKAPKGSCLTQLSIIDNSGNEIDYNKASDIIIDGDEIIYSFSFVMPATNVTISGETGEGFIAAVDSSAFEYDSNGEAEAYIELMEYPTETYNKDYVIFPSDKNELKGRFVYSENYHPTHIRIVGQDTGKVFVDEDVNADSAEFVYSTSDLSAFGENILVTPTFAKTDFDVRKIGISTYEELVEFAENVSNDYQNYGKADVWLENNIMAPDNAAWTLPIGTNGKPFAGTFDGKGYIVVGLDMALPDNGGLFGVIGEGGLVKDLVVINSSFSTKSAKSGGIAAVNYGTIDHCISGVNVDYNLTVNLKNGKKIHISDLNSMIRGDCAGGIAAENYGTIIGSRNGSYVKGDKCGGLVCVNYGDIYGCANNGPVGADSSIVELCGGLTGENHGTIESSYNSGKETGGVSTKLGNIAVNNFSEAVNNVFYSDVNSIPAIDPDSKVKLNSTNIMIKNSEMMTPQFVSRLNNVTENENVSWKQIAAGKTYLNRGYPVIENGYLVNRQIKTASGITLKGMMHSALNVSYEAVAADDELYSTLQSAAPAKTLLSAYNVSCQDSIGNYVPSELWCGGVTVTVPVDGEDAEIVIIDSKGDAQLIKPDSISDGKASFNVAEPVSFAVVKNSTSSGANTTTDTVTTETNTPYTGENSLLIFTFLTALISAGASIILIKRRSRR